MTTRAIAAGVAIGVAYALSPLLVITAVGFALVIRWARQVPDDTERRLLTAMLGVAIGLRVMAIAGLTLSTDHNSVPFGTFFGDEDYFIKRSIWLRNLAVGIPLSLADVRYAFDDSIQTSFVWILATCHLLFGPSPYGLHFVSALVYLVGSFALYRTVRPGFGRPASMIGLALLLFLPSLFAWSIAVLKEPWFFGVMAGVVSITIAAVRQPSWIVRLVAGAVMVPVAWVAETMRDGGLVVASLGTIGGVMLWWLLTRPKLAMAVAIIAIAAVPLAMSRGDVRDRLDLVVSRAAVRHWDHVHAPGHSYMIFPPSFYVERPPPGCVSRADAARMALAGLAAYVIVPAPWQMTSRAELAYLPEQMVWYGLVVLAPFGLWAGLRRDPALTAVLFVHFTVAVVLVAMTSGNVGTLVRHRALALTYMVWFSGLGLSVLLAKLAGTQVVAAHPHGLPKGAEA